MNRMRTRERFVSCNSVILTNIYRGVQKQHAAIATGDLAVVGKERIDATAEYRLRPCRNG